MASDEETFRRLYPDLRRFAAVVGGLGQDPDDLVQEAVVRALRRGSLHELASPGSYLRRAILNLAHDSRRSSLRRDRALDRLRRDAETPAQDPGSGRLDDLEHLAPVERAVLYLVDVEGYSFDEASSLIGISVTAARSRASRARRRLRGLIEEDDS